MDTNTIRKSLDRSKRIGAAIFSDSPEKRQARAEFLKQQRLEREAYELKKKKEEEERQQQMAQQADAAKEAVKNAIEEAEEQKKEDIKKIDGDQPTPKNVLEDKYNLAKQVKTYREQKKQKSKQLNKEFGKFVPEFWNEKADFDISEGQFGAPYIAETPTARNIRKRKEVEQFANDTVDAKYAEDIERAKANLKIVSDKNATNLSHGIVTEDVRRARQELDTIQAQADRLKTDLITANDPRLKLADEIENIGFNSSVYKRQLAIEQLAKTRYRNKRTGVNTVIGNPATYGVSSIASNIIEERFRNTTAGIEEEAARAEYETQLRNTEKMDNEIQQLKQYITNYGIPTNPNSMPRNIQELLQKYAPQYLEAGAAASFNIKNKFTNEQLKQYVDLAHDQKQQLDQTKQNESDLNIAELENLRDEAILKYEVLSKGNYGQSLNEDPQNYKRAASQIQKAINHKKRYEAIVNSGATKIDSFGDFAKLVGNTGMHVALQLISPSGVAMSEQNKADLKAAWEGTKAFFEDYEDDVHQLGNALETLKIKERIDNKGPLTKSQKDYLTALGIESIANDKWGDYQKYIGYQSAEIGLESAPFMLQFMATSGAVPAFEAAASNAAKYTTKAILKGITKFGKKKFSQAALKTAALTARGAGVLTGDALYATALANTLQLPKTISSIIDLRTGKVDAHQLDNGKVEVSGFKDGMSWGDAIFTGEARTFTENFSEMLSGVLGRVGDRLFNPKYGIISKWKPKIGQFLKDVDDMTSFKFDSFTKELAERTQFHGIFGETMEEYYGILMNHALGTSENTWEDGTKKTIWEDITDVNQFFSIVGGIGLSIGMMGVAGGAHYGAVRSMYNNANNNARKEFGDSWDKIKNTIDGADINNTASVVSRFADSYANDPNKVAAIFDYYTNLNKYRGATVARSKQLQDEHQSAYLKARREAKQTGYNADNLLLRKDYETVAQILGDQVRQDILKEFEGSGLEKESTDKLIQIKYGSYENYIQSMLNEADQLENQLNQISSEYDPRERANRALAYLHTLDVIQGTKERESDDRQLATYDALSKVPKMLNINGNVQYAQLNEEVEGEDGKTFKPSVSIVRGDPTKDKTVLVYDISTGHLRSIQSEEIDKETIGEELPAIVAQAAIIKSVDERFNKFGEDLQKRTGLEVGTVHPLADGRTLTIIDSTRDGGMLYQLNDSGKNDGPIQHVESVNSMKQLLYDIEKDRVRTIQDQRLENAAKTIISDYENKQTQQINDEEAAAGNAVIQQKFNQQARETAKNDAQAHIPAKSYGGREVSGSVAEKKARKVIDRVKQNTSYSKFKQMLKNQDLTIDLQHDQRLHRLFDAYRKGNITAAQFAKVFNKAEDTTDSNMSINDGGDVTVARTNPLVSTENTELTKLQNKYAPQLERMSSEYDDWTQIDDEISQIEKELPAGYEVGLHNGKFAIIEKPVVSTPQDVIINPAPIGTQEGVVEAANKATLSTEQQRVVDDIVAAISKLQNAPNIQIKERFRGKLIYAQDGTGKSWIKLHIPNVVDSDEILKKLTGGKQYSEIPQDKRSAVWQKYNEEIRRLASEGKTVLTTSKQMIGEADVLIHNESVELTTKRTNAENRRNRFSDPNRAQAHLDAIQARIERDPGVEHYALNETQYASDILAEDVTKLPTSLEVLGELKQTYEDLFGYAIISMPLFLDERFVERSTGTIRRFHQKLDMIAVDRTGAVHIISLQQLTDQDKSELAALVQNKLEVDVYDVDTVSFENDGSVARDTSSPNVSNYKPLKDALEQSIQKLRSSYTTVEDVSALSELPENTSDKVRAMFNEVVNLTTQLLQSYDLGKVVTVNDARNVLEQYLKILQLARTANNALEDEINNQSHEDALNDEAKVNIEKTQRVVSEEELELVLSDTARFTLQIESTFNANVQQLKDLIGQIKASGGENNPQVVPEQIREQIDQLIANIDALLQFNAVIINGQQSGFLFDIDEDSYLQAKKELDDILQVDGTGSEPKIPSVNNVQPEGSALSRPNVMWAASFGKSNGLDQAVAVDDPNLKLRDVTSNADFIVNAKFEFVHNPLAGKSGRIAVKITYDGHTYTPVDLNASTAFFGRVMRAIRTSNGKAVVPTSLPRRSIGFVRPGDHKSIEDAGLVSYTKDGSAQYIYDVEFSENQEEYGIVKIMPGPNNTKQYVVVSPGSTANSNHVLYTYPSDMTRQPAEGQIVRLVKLPFQEILPEHRPLMPVECFNTTISEKDADLIVGILTGKYSIDSTLSPMQQLRGEFVENGEGKGLTCIDVLNMFIPYGAYGEQSKAHIHLKYDSQNAHIIHLIDSRRNASKQLISDLRFDLSTQEGIDSFKEELQKHTRSTDWEFMANRFGSAQQDSKVMAKAEKALMKRKQNGKKVELTFGQSSIRFTEDDFKEQGLSGLGWYIKNGFIDTNFNGVFNSIISFDEDTGIEVVDPIQVQPHDEQTYDETSGNPIDESIAGSDYTTDMVDTDEEGSLYRVVKGELPQTLDENTARENLISIFGEQFAFDPVTTRCIDTIVASMRSGARVVGRCTLDCIILSKYAEQGDEYHEAFHRIVELLMTEKERNKIYQQYRIVHKGQNLTEYQVREGLSDTFKEWALGAPIKLLSGGIKNNFRYILQFIKMWWKLGHGINSYKLTKTFSDVQRGKYINSKPTQENVDRFAAKFPSGLAMQVRGVELPHILNEYQYKQYINSLAYMLVHPSSNEIDWSNIKPEDIVVSKEKLINSKPFQFRMQAQSVPSSTKAALQEIIDNWEAVVPDVVSYIHQFTTDYQTKYEDEERSQKDGSSDNPDVDPTTTEQDMSGADLSQHIKASYEFSPYTRTSQKIRGFFAGIQYQRWGVNKDGKRIPIVRTNSLGLPELINPRTAFATALNYLHGINSIPEMIAECRRIGETDVMFAVIANRLNKIYLDSKDKNSPTKNDSEAFVTQMFGCMKSAKNQFDIAMSRKYGDMFTIDIIDTDKSYKSGNYVRDWSQLFAKGASKYIYEIQPGVYAMRGKYSPKIFYKLADRIAEQNPNLSKEPLTAANILYKKQQLVQAIQSMGIIFDEDMLDYMLLKKFGDSGEAGLSKLFEQSGKGSIQSFIKLLNGLVYEDNKTGKVELNLPDNVGNIFNQNTFVFELAKYKYEYVRDHDQLTVLATGGNNFYVISENNLITDRVDELEKDPQFVERMLGIPYNAIESTTDLKGNKIYRGSAVLKHVKVPGHTPLRFHTFIGFKSDARGDQGIDYTAISLREDYIAKSAILLRGGMLFATLADKKTYGYITGVNLPGLQFESTSRSERYIPKMTTGQPISSTLETLPDGTTLLPFSDEILEQMLEYAETENAAVEQMINSAELPENQKVNNYHKGEVQVGNKSYPIVQGARYTTILGVWENGNFIEFNTTLDENGEYTDEVACYQKAQEHFFSKSKETKKQIIKEMLSRQLSQELEYLSEIGLIRRISNDPKVPTFMQYINQGLDQAVLDAVFNKMTEGLTGLTIAKKNEYRAIALAHLVGDIMCKHIMSLQENERIFSGHPSFFNFQYDENGHLIDRSKDLSKRLGGIISTGQNNNLDLDDIAEDYVCTEIADDVIVSEEIENLSKLIISGELKQAYINQRCEQEQLSYDDIDETSEIYQDVVKMSDEEIESKLLPSILPIVKQKAEGKIKALRKINVADGAAYISDKMCENLLRMNGSWSEEIAKAFKILRGEPVDGKIYTTKDIFETYQAYQLVYTTVIGSQKYSAYGYRFQNNLAVPYYDKMALFPIFKCMATGKMADMFEKMNKEGIDMLMLSSAVKVGGQGAITSSEALNGTKFNKYYQKYKYLRKQFNTDPKEKELLHMGTQMTKVVLSALPKGGQFVVNGQTLNSIDVRDNIMEALNKMSSLGLQKLQKKFFNEDGSFNIDKFSKMLTDELSRRGANREMLDAVTVVEDVVRDSEGNVVIGPKTGKPTIVPNLKLTLDAIGNSNWIQSILASMINKDVVDTNTPGKAFIQRSAWLMEGKSQIIDDSNLPPSINNGNSLKVINEEGSMDCVLSIDFFSEILNKAKVKRNGEVVKVSSLSFNEQKQWLIEHGLIGPTAKGNIIGYRIPTQAVSSIHALRCVDVLPVVRDTIILPKDFTSITGADKQYHCSHQYNINNPFNCGKLSQIETTRSQDSTYTFVE